MNKETGQQVDWLTGLNVSKLTAQKRRIESGYSGAAGHGSRPRGRASSWALVARQGPGGPFVRRGLFFQRPWRDRELDPSAFQAYAGVERIAQRHELPFPGIEDQI